MALSSIASPASPSLSHGSSSAPDFDEYLDLGAIDQSTSAPVQIASGEATNDFESLYRQYFPQDKTINVASPPFDYMQSYPSLFPTEDDSSTLPSINPSLMDSIMDSVDGTPSEAADEAMDQDLAELFSPPEHDSTGDSAYSPAGSEQQLTKRARRTTRSAAVTQNKRKAKSVADLALPLPASKAAKPVLVLPSVAEDFNSEDGSKGNHHLPHIVFPVPDYIDKPSAEEYGKMSSKEKRQLRNKISARNFRHRRKEYITTLEEEIAGRDSTISTLQEEMGILRTENTTLRSDLDLLKSTVEKLLAEARPKTPVASTSSLVRSPSPFLPNLNKDVSPFSNFGPGGVGSSASNINVHTTFIPSSTSVFAQPRNMNPAMNREINTELLSHLPGNKQDDSFWGANPYTLTGAATDQYRSMLYGKLAQNLNGLKAARADPSAVFKPSFFAPFTSKGAVTASRSSDDVDDLLDSDVDSQINDAVLAQTVLVAELAQQTLVQGLLTSFWQTFTGTNPHASPRQVADLLAGRAQMRVVPAASIEEISDSLADLTVGVESQQSIVQRALRHRYSSGPHKP